MRPMVFAIEPQERGSQQQVVAYIEWTARFCFEQDGAHRSRVQAQVVV